jgi:hypothetical protein
MANKYTAQLLEDFASTKKDGSNRHEVKWKDYEKIQNMKRQDVTDSKKFINDELERISKLQGKPDGTLYTDAEKQEMKKEWEHLKASIE